LRGVDFECLVEGAAGGQHAKFLIEDQERLGDRVDDRLRQRLRILDIRDGLKHGQKPDEWRSAALRVDVTPLPRRCREVNRRPR